MAAKKIELPPVVTEALVGLGNFLGRHVAEGVKQGKKSALKEIGEQLKRAGEIVERATKDEPDEIEVLDGEDRKR